jgi:hypothetical protein
MAVSTVAIWVARPGRAGEFLASAAKAKAIHERLGGKVRLRQIVMGGPNAQQFVYTIEHANMAAFATFSDKFQADKEWTALWTAANSTDPTATLVSHSLTTDVPGF